MPAKFNSAEKSHSASKYPGMGAIPSASGVTFCVWAPHAEKVYVTGTFNGWSKTSASLSSEHNGYWSTEVPGAKVGDEYRFMIHTPVTWKLPPFSRIEPYARKVTNSVGNGIIYDPKAFDWGYDNFKMTSWNELVIYEMHIGTFNVKEHWHPGAFDNAMEKLPYLNELGINAIGFPRAGLWKTRFNSDSHNYGQDFANHPSPDIEAHEENYDGLPCSGKINIGPYTVVIYSQDK